MRTGDGVVYYACDYGSGKQHLDGVAWFALLSCPAGRCRGFDCRKVGIHFTRPLAMTPSWWGGPPGPRGTPPSRCRTRARMARRSIPQAQPLPMLPQQQVRLRQQPAVRQQLFQRDLANRLISSGVTLPLTRRPLDSSASTPSAPANIRIFSAPGSPVIGNCMPSSPFAEAVSARLSRLPPKWSTAIWAASHQSA